MENGESSSGTSSSSGDKNKDEKEDEDKDNMSKEERQIFDAKFKELQVYVPLIKKLLASYEQKKKTGSCDVQIEKQYQRFKSLHALFTTKRRCKLDTLLKCEEFFKKRFKNKGNESSPESVPSKPPEKANNSQRCSTCKKNFLTLPHAEDCVCCTCKPPAIDSTNYVCSGPKPGPNSEKKKSKSWSSASNFGFASSGSFSSKFSPRCLQPKPGQSGETSDVIVITDDEGKSPAKSVIEELTSKTKPTPLATDLIVCPSNGVPKTSSSQKESADQTSKNEEVRNKPKNERTDGQNKLPCNKISNAEAKNSAQNKEENKEKKVPKKPPLSQSMKNDEKKMRAQVTNQLDSKTKPSQSSHDPASTSASTTSNRVTIPDLSQVDIPDHVYEIVKNLQLRMPTTYLNSKFPFQTQDSTFKANSGNPSQKHENASSPLRNDEPVPYQDSFDIEPLHPSDRGLSPMSHIYDRQKSTLSSQQPTYSSAHSSAVSISHNIQTNCTSSVQSNVPRHGMHTDRSMNKVPNHTDKKPHLSDPRRPPTTNFGSSSTQLSHNQSNSGRPRIADPRRRISSELQPSNPSISNQNHPQATSIASSWSHAPSRLSTTLVSSQLSHSGPIRPYQYPAYVTPQVSTHGVSHHPPAFTSRSISTSNTIAPSVHRQANRTSRFNPVLSPQDSASPAEDIIMNEDMQMSPDSPQSGETPTPTCSEREISGAASIRSKLAEGITAMKKLGKTSEDKHRKDRMISNLKPGVLNDLAASKETKNSLFVDSLVNAQVPSSDRKDPKSITPVKHAKVPEKNIDTVNSLKTYPAGLSSSKPPPIRLAKKPILPTASLGRGNCDNTRFPSSNVPGSSNLKIPQRNSSTSSFNESIRTCFSANNESNSSTDFNETFRSSFHNTSAPTYSSTLPRVESYDSYRMPSSSLHRPVDSLHRSLSSPDPPDLWSQTAARWNTDVHPNLDRRDRYDDYYASQRPNDRHIGDYRFNDHRPGDQRSNEHRPIERGISDHRQRDHRLSDSRTSESIRPRLHTADPRARKVDSTANVRKQNPRDEDKSSHMRDPRRRGSLETQGSHERPRSRLPESGKKSSVSDTSKSHQKSNERSNIKKVQESDEREDFLSPLDNSARKPTTSVTGRGYGIQNYKIPKRPRPQAQEHNSRKENFGQPEVSPSRNDDTVDVDMNLNDDASPDDIVDDQTTSFSTTEAEAEHSKQSMKSDIKSKKEDASLSKKPPPKHSTSKVTVNDEVKEQSNVEISGHVTDLEICNEDAKKLKEDSSKSKKSSEKSKVAISDILQKTARVVISSDEESLARENKDIHNIPSKQSKAHAIISSDEESEKHSKKSDKNTKSDSVSKKDIKTDPKKIVISDSSNDECDTTIQTKEPCNKSKAKEPNKGTTTKSKVKKKSEISPSESASESDTSSKGKKVKASKRSSSNKKSLVESDSESDVSSKGKKKKATKMSSSNKNSHIGDKATKKKVLSGDSSDSDVLLKKLHSKKNKKAVKKGKVHHPISDGSSSENDDTDTIERGKKLGQQKRSTSEESLSSSSDSSSSASSVKSCSKLKNKQKLNSKMKNAKSEKSKISESKITSSKKSGPKKKPKSTPAIVISSDSSDDEVLAVKVKKIKDTSSSENIVEKPISDLKKTESTIEHQNAVSEEAIQLGGIKTNQISCNKVDSTSDTNEPAAPKTPAAEASEDLASLLFKELLTGKADQLQPLLLSVMLKDKLGPNTSENIEFVKKLMEGDTLDKIRKMITVDEATSSSAEPTKKEEETPNERKLETSEGTVPEIMTEKVPATLNESAEVPVKEDIPETSNKSIPKATETYLSDENQHSKSAETSLPTQVPEVMKNDQQSSSIGPMESLSSSAPLIDPKSRDDSLKSVAGCLAQGTETGSSNHNLVQASNAGQVKNEEECSSVVETMPIESALSSQSGPKSHNLDCSRKRKRGKKTPKIKNTTNWRQRSIDLSQNSADSLSVEERNKIYKEMCVGAVKNFETGPKQRSKKNELDKLHEDIRESFISEDVIKATGVRSCRVKAYEIDPVSADDSPEKIPVARGRKKSSERTEIIEKTTKIKSAKVRRKSSTHCQYVDSSDTDEDVHKKPKCNSSDSPPPVLEAVTDFKEREASGVTKVVRKLESSAEEPPKLYPSHEIMPLVDPPSFCYLPEIYALDYFTPKFKRKKFNLSQFERKYFLVKREISDLNRCSADTNSKVKFFGCGRRLDRKRKIASLFISRTISSGPPEPKKSKICQSQVKSVQKARVSVKESTPVMGKMTLGRVTRTQVNKEAQKPVGPKESTKVKTAEEKETAMEKRRVMHLEEPDLDDFILILDSKAEKWWTRVKNTLQTFNSITPKVTADKAAKQYELKSEVDWTDPDYYFKSGVSMDCKLCSYSGCYISDHYLLYHSEDQVLSSRLHYEEGESAIAESIFLDYSDVPDEFLIRFPASKECDGTVINKESLNKLLLKKWLKDHSDDLTGVFHSLVENSVWKKENTQALSTHHGMSKMPADLLDLLYRAYRAKMRTKLFFCRMCSNIYDSARKFFEHCSLHTGEYPYECTPCQLILPSVDDFVFHQENSPGSSHFLSNRYPLPSDSSILFGYICSSCNYVQLVYENLVRHLTYHKDDKLKPQIVRINMSKLSSSLYAESSEDVVAKKWHDYKKEDVTSCSCPKFYTSFEDPKDVAKHFEKLSLKDSPDRSLDSSTQCINPFARSFSYSKQKLNLTYTNQGAPFPRSHIFESPTNSCFIENSNFEKYIESLTKVGRERYLFCSALRVNVRQLNRKHVTNPPNLVMDEEGRSTEHNYAFMSSGAELSSTQSDKESRNSAQSCIKFLEDLNKRLSAKGGRNYLNDLEKKLKPTEVEVVDSHDARPLNQRKQASDVLNHNLGASSESEAPTIHIPDSVECSLPKIMNVIDFNLQMTTESPAERISVFQPPNTFLNLGNLLLPSQSTESTPSAKPAKALPPLLPMKKSPRIQQYIMKDPVVRKIKVGPIGAVKLTNHIVFSCFAPRTYGTTCEYRTETAEKLVIHFNTYHPDIKWTGLCEPCGKPIVARGLEKYPISIASNHLISAHLSPVTFFELVEPDASAAKPVDNVIPEPRPLIVIKNLQRHTPGTSTSTLSSVPPKREESTSVGVGNAAPAPPAPPQQPRLRVRPLEEMLDHKLLNQQILNSSTPEKDPESSIQISSVMSLSSLNECFPSKFVSESVPKSAVEDLHFLEETDKFLYLTPSGPKRLLSITLKDPGYSGITNPELPKKTLYKFKLQSGTVMEELLKGQSPKFINAVKKCGGSVLFMFCRECLIYHNINIDMFKIECPEKPRKLALKSKELKFSVTETPAAMVNHRLTHSVYPLLIPQNYVKSPAFYEAMLGPASLVKLFKCMGAVCSYAAIDGASFIRHITNHEVHFRAIIKKLGKKAQFLKHMKTKEWNLCAYCGFSADGPIDLKDHIENDHGKSQFQCGYCFYRGFAKWHVAWHQVYAHEDKEPLIFACYLGTSKSLPSPSVDNIKPFECAVGSCSFKTYARNSFQDHLSAQHINCNFLSCHVCGVQYFTIDRLIKHYKLHNYYQYQCMFCNDGSESLEEMKLHLLNNHFTRASYIIYRVLPSEAQRQAQSKMEWAQRNRLDDKIVLLLLKDTKGEVKAISCDEPLMEESEDVAMEDDVYIQMISQVMDFRACKGASEKTTAESVEQEEVELESGNPLKEGFSNLEFSNAQSGGLESRLLPFIITAEQKKKIEERRQLHQATLENRLKALEGAYKPESRLHLLPTPRDGFKDLKHILSTSSSVSSLTKYLQNPSDLKKDTGTFELTQDCINSLSLDFNDTVDLNTLYDMVESPAALTETSQVNCNQSSNGASKNPNDISSSSSSQATDGAEETGLSGFDLYRCGNEGCSFAAESSNDLKDHVLMCDLSRSSSSLTCVHCKKLCKAATTLVDHLRTHGTQRFFCSLCPMRAPVPYRIASHLKSAHRINSTRLHPVNPLQTDIDNSVFILVPKDKQLIGVNKVNAKTGCKISFSPNEISEIPQQKIYAEPMWCAVCPYKSMVRINLLNHLRNHAIGNEPLIKDYFNPMPTSESKELEPLTNHALSARMAEEKAMKEDGSPILTENIMEDIHSNFQTEFVPPNGRYKCHVADCSYITVDANTLCNHLKFIHSDVKTYLCPHCPRDLVQAVKIDKIGSHLKFHDETLHKCSYCNFFHHKKHMVDRHVVLEHPSLAQKTELIRGSDSSKHDSSDTAQAPQDAQRSALKPWHCGLCRYRTFVNTEIAVHCFSVHGVYNQYKCVLCTYSNNSLYDFNAHYIEKHQGISKQILCVYEEISTVSDNDPVNDVLATRDICHYIPEKFRLKNGLAEERVSLSAEEYVKLKCRNRMLATLGIDDKNGLHGPLGEPDSKGNFVCPRCKEYRTANVEDMKCHMYRELSYKLFKCGHCNLASSQFHDLFIHSEEHMRLGDEPCVQQLEPNPDYDAWIDRMIAVQKSMMKSKKEGQGKDDPAVVESKFWRFGVCSRECTPSYQHFCPNIPIRPPADEDSAKQDTKLYRQPPVSDESEVDNFIDLIVSDSDDECTYKLAPESIPSPAESLSATLTMSDSKIEKYRKSKLLPRIDLKPPQYTVLDESNLQLFESSSEDEIIVDSDGEEVQSGSSRQSDLTDSPGKSTSNVCVDCGKTFNSVGRLKAHIRYAHLQTKKYVCRLCKENCLHFLAMKSHLYKIHGDSSDKNYTVLTIAEKVAALTPEFWAKRYNIQPEPAKKVPKKPVTSPLEDYKYGCHYCPYRAGDLAIIYVHWRQKHKEPVLLTGGKLKASTSVPFLYRNHSTGADSAEDKIMYQCVHCEHRGLIHDIISHHLKIHPTDDFLITCLGQIKYKCAVCHLDFITSENLKRHFSQSHPGKEVQCHFFARAQLPMNRIDDKNKNISFLEGTNKPGKLVFFGCPICRYFSDDRKKIHAHLRIHIDVYVCKGCKTNFTEVHKANYHCHYECTKSLKIKSVKKTRLSKRGWEDLKASVKCFESSITEYHLSKKYLPIKMPQRKRKHRTKGIPQRSDVKRMKLSHCARKSTASISALVASTSSAVVKVNQTARKSTGPRPLSEQSGAPYSFYGRIPDPVDFNRVNISFHFGGTQAVRPVRLLSELMNINLNPFVKVEDCEKIKVKRNKKPELVELTDTD